MPRDLGGVLLALTAVRIPDVTSVWAGVSTTLVRDFRRNPRGAKLVWSLH